MVTFRRKGFTLIELLIVIVVIGILAAMMMLSSTEAVISAKANNITATLRDLRTAAMAWHADNPDKDFPFAQSSHSQWKEIISYLNNNNKSEAGELSKYYFQPYGFNSDREFWYVQYKIEGPDSEAIKKRLAGQAQMKNLLKSSYGGDVARNNTGNIENETQNWNNNREAFFDGTTDIVLYRIF